MKLIKNYHNLSTKLLIAMMVWVVCAVLFTGYALSLLWQLETAGIAINDTGSLRMRVYHMVLLAHENNDRVFKEEQQKFITSLNHLKQFNNRLIFPNNKKIKSQIKYIENTYYQTILPHIEQVRNNPALLPDNAGQFSSFVNDINTLVKLIENQNTEDIIWLRFIELSTILMVLITAFSGAYFLYRSIIMPLQRLQDNIKKVSLETRSKRVSTNKQNEFGIISSSVNQMAHNLQDMYNNLEQKVSQKTIAFKKKNQELTILYDMISLLHGCLSPTMAIEKFLDRTIELSEADAGFIGLLNEKRNSLNLIHSKGFSNPKFSIEQCYFAANCFFDINSIPKSPHPVFIRTDQKNKCMIPTCVKAQFDHFIIFPLLHNNHEIGLMILYFKKKEANLPQQTSQLITTLTQQLAVYIENQQLATKEKQLAVMEERNLIAQGLHDSIAQSLSFLNMQVQMLQKAIDKQDFRNMKQNLAFIQDGIQGCYDDVRELLNNFRTKISQDDFESAVTKVIERFKAQTQISVNVENLQKILFPDPAATVTDYFHPSGSTFQHPETFPM